MDRTGSAEIPIFAQGLGPRPLAAVVDRGPLGVPSFGRPPTPPTTSDARYPDFQSGYLRSAYRSVEDLGRASSNLLIEARDIHKSFKQPHGGPTHILQGVDLKLKAGEKIAIMGPSGSGKSTLLHILGLMESPDQGELSLLGRKISRDDELRDGLRRNLVGFLFQFDSLIEELTVLENFKFQISLKTWGGSAKEEALKRMSQLCEKFNLSPVLDSYPAALSGGEKTRANLIRALLGSPKILLADEPTGNLDHKNAQAIMEMLTTLLDENLKDRQNIGGVVVATHNIEVAQKMDKIYELHEGKLKPAKGV